MQDDITLQEMKTASDPAVLRPVMMPKPNNCELLVTPEYSTVSVNYMKRLEKPNGNVFLSQSGDCKSIQQTHSSRNRNEAQSTVKLPPPVFVLPKVKNKIKLQAKSVAPFRIPFGSDLSNDPMIIRMPQTLSHTDQIGRLSKFPKRKWMRFLSETGWSDLHECQSMLS